MWVCAYLCEMKRERETLWVDVCRLCERKRERNRVGVCRLCEKKREGEWVGMHVCYVKGRSRDTDRLCGCV